MVWRRILAVSAVLAAVGAAAWVVFFSSLLAVVDVEVRGERSLSVQHITRAADVPVGEPMARVDLDDVTARVDRLPPVRRVEVNRSWPDTVLITVEERTAVAVVVRDGRHTLIDADGVQFREVPGPRRRLPTIEAGRARAAAEAAEVVSALPADVLRRVEHLDATTMDSITLQLRGGREVVWGSAEDSARKAQVLAVLVERKGSVINVSVPSAPTVRLG